MIIIIKVSLGLKAYF